MPRRGAIECTVGWSFTTNEPITVYALDALVSSVNATGENVRLYDGSKTVLASATISTSDATEGSPQIFYTVPITPVNLAAATTYYIAMDLSSTLGDVAATGVTTDAAITFGGAVSAGPGLNPTFDLFASDPAAYFGPNFDAVPTPSAVPEPSSLMLLGSGLVLGVRQWRKGRHNKKAA